MWVFAFFFILVIYLRPVTCNQKILQLNFLKADS